MQGWDIQLYIVHDMMFLDENKDHQSTTQTMEFWDIPPVKKHRAEFEGPQYNIDPEKTIHSPDLYAIWASKSWMLLQTALENPFGSHFFSGLTQGLGGELLGIQTGKIA